MLTLCTSVALNAVVASFPLPALAIDKTWEVIEVSPHLGRYLTHPPFERGVKLDAYAKELSPVFLTEIRLALETREPTTFSLDGKSRSRLKGYAEPFGYQGNDEVHGVWITFVELTDPANAGLHNRTASSLSPAESEQTGSVSEQRELPLAYFTPDHRITLLNQAFRTAFARRESVVGSQAAKILSGPAADSLMAAVTRVTQEGQDSILAEIPVESRNPWNGNLAAEYYSVYFQPCQSLSPPLQGGVVYALEVTKQVLAQKHRQAEQALTESNFMVEQRTAKLREMALELCLVEERERRDLSQFLHDEVQQLIVAAKLRLHRLHSDLPPKEFLGTLESCTVMLNECLSTIRTLSVELCPPLVYDKDIPAMLGWIAELQRERFGLDVEIQSSLPSTYPIPDPLKHLISQAVQELLFNVTKYSGVQQASVKIEPADPDMLQITVEDHGKGSQAHELDSGMRKRIGLGGIQRKVEALGGKFFVFTEPGKGFRVLMVIPVKLTPNRESGEPIRRASFGP